MQESDLNRYFFAALQQLLNLSDTTYVTNYRIWFYELPWADRKVTRPGYLFLGAPDERSTAQPPRDFYVYILPPFLDRAYHDEQRPDEVIFQLTALGQDFEDIVRLYAGARSLAGESPQHREDYANKADTHLRKLVRWLRDNLAHHLQVTYQGVTEPVGTVLTQTRSTASQNMEELLQLVAAHLLTPDWEERYPDYPAFTRLSQPVSESARPTNAMEAARSLAGRGRTQLVTAVLEGLRLLDDEGNVRPYDSPYASQFLDLLQRKPEGQVVNRGELIEQIAGGLQPVEKDITFHLEPEWVAVVLLSLVYNGDIVLKVDNRENLDASSIERAATLDITDLTDFRFYSRPRSLPVNLWTEIFEGLELVPGLIRDENTRVQAVQDLQQAVQAELERTATVQGRLEQGLTLWNTPLFTDRFAVEVEAGWVVSTERPEVPLSTVDVLPPLRRYKEFLETLTQFNTVGKLRNLRLTAGNITQATEDRQATDRAEKLLALVGQIQPLTTYLAEAQANLPPEHPWSQRANESQTSLIYDVRRFAKGEDTRDARSLSRELETLKQEYVTAYTELHRRLVLGAQGDDLRQQLYGDPRLSALNILSSIELLNRAELESWQQALRDLPTCREFREGAISTTPTCPFCKLRPSQRRDENASQVLDRLDTRLDDLLGRWRQALHDNLESDTARGSLEAMAPGERRPIEGFLSQPNNETNVPEGFVQAAVQALRGIEAVTLGPEDLLESLKTGGLPCTVAELQRRFNSFVQQAMRGHDARNTRLTLEE